ncbi:MAG: RHS repeat-associated core domain-containing protein [Pseudomonadota bacterium]
MAAFDSLGQAVRKASYAPFDALETVEVDTNAIERPAPSFPGQWFQAEHGLHQNWFRDYDPNTGRYLQADPLGLVDGPSVYGYARQASRSFVHPRGLQAASMDGPISLPESDPTSSSHIGACVRALGRLAGGAISIIHFPSDAGQGLPVLTMAAP